MNQYSTVEVLSPNPPSEPTMEDQSFRTTKDDLLQQISKVSSNHVDRRSSKEADLVKVDLVHQIAARNDASLLFGHFHFDTP